MGIASLPRERAGAKALLGLTRGHWGIENNLHGVRDGTLREDASRIPEGVVDAGDGDHQEHRHLRLQPAGLCECRDGHATLRLPPRGDA